MTSLPPGGEADGTATAVQRTGPAHAAMLVYICLISTSFPVGAAITNELDPVVLTFVRFCLAASVIGGVLLVRGRALGVEQFRWPKPKDLLRYAVISASIVLFFIAMFEALRWTTPLSTGALSTLVPLMTAGVAFLLIGQKCNGTHLVCLLIGGAGALWVVFDGDVELLRTFSLGRGEIIFIFGCLAFSAYTPLIVRLQRGEPAIVLTFWTTVMGAVLLGLGSLPLFASVNWPAVPAKVWIGLVYLAVFNTAFTFFLLKTASMRLPAHKVMAYSYLVPALVTLLEGMLGHGWPGLAVLAGIAVTASATFLLQRV